jgi:hypothetical protein
MRLSHPCQSPAEQIFGFPVGWLTWSVIGESVLFPITSSQPGSFAVLHWKHIMPLTETTDSISAVPSNVIYVETGLKSKQYFNGSRQ